MKSKPFFKKLSWTIHAKLNPVLFEHYRLSDLFALATSLISI